MQRDWSRGVILPMSRRQDRFKVHQCRSQNPKHWGKNMPLYPGPVSWNQSLCGGIDVKPSVRCYSCQRHPDQPLDAKEPLNMWGKHLLVFLFLLLLLCLSLTLSLSHTPQTHARTSRYTRREKVTFPVLLRQYDSYFRVVTCSAERRGRCKADTKSRWKLQQITVFFIMKKQKANMRLKNGKGRFFSIIIKRNEPPFSTSSIASCMVLNHLLMESFLYPPRTVLETFLLIWQPPHGTLLQRFTFSCSGRCLNR